MTRSGADIPGLLAALLQPVGLASRKRDAQVTVWQVPSFARLKAFRVANESDGGTNTPADILP